MDRELINRPSLSEPGRLYSLLISDAIGTGDLSGKESNPQ